MNARPQTNYVVAKFEPCKPTLYFTADGKIALKLDKAAILDFRTANEYCTKGDDLFHDGLGAWWHGLGRIG